MTKLKQLFLVALFSSVVSTTACGVETARTGTGTGTTIEDDNEILADDGELPEAVQGESLDSRRHQQDLDLADKLADLHKQYVQVKCGLTNAACGSKTLDDAVIAPSR